MGNCNARPATFKPKNLPMEYPKKYAMYPTRRRMRASERRTYKRDCKNLLESVAGENPFEGDEETANNYTEAIFSISIKAKVLKTYMDLIESSINEECPVNGHIQLFCNEINNLSHLYEVFFRKSIVSVDTRVEERKEIARAAYRDIKNLTIIIYLNKERSKTLLQSVMMHTEFQTHQAEKLVEHYEATFSPILKEVLPDPNAPRIHRTPTRAQIIAFWEEVRREKESGTLGTPF